MLPDVQALKQTLEALIIKMTQYDEESLNVSGTKRLLRRMQKEAEIVDQLAQQGEAASIVRISGAVNNGCCWIEVKCLEPFDLGSSQWLGSFGHVKGVQQQALQRLKVAAAPCNHRRWRAPAVVFHFPSGVAESVCHELSGIGVHVTGPGALHASMLPAPPPEPVAVNLDVTTLCAMVSEVCNSDVTHPDIQQWAVRVSHWQLPAQPGSLRSF
eukprot:jgi/Astpho2/584/Aster-x0025